MARGTNTNRCLGTGGLGSVVDDRIAQGIEIHEGNCVGMKRMHS
jgi:hypothetical protein